MAFWNRHRSAEEEDGWDPLGDLGYPKSEGTAGAEGREDGSVGSGASGDAWRGSASADGFGWDDASDVGDAAARRPDVRSGRPSILVVCTGNVCRSPYVERRLGHELLGSGIEVRSAGTGALVGREMEPESARLLEAVGVSSAGFAARQLTEQMVENADLVLVAAREHRRAVVQLVPAALSKTYLLTDFADLVRGVVSSPTRVANRVEQLVGAAQTRRAEVPARVGDDADIVDPFGQGAEVFARMRDEAEPAIRTIADALYGRPGYGWSA